MRLTLTIAPLLIAACAASAAAQDGPAAGHAAHDAAQRDALIRNALSAAPRSVAEHATIVDHHGNVLREGRSAWVCMPTLPDLPDTDAPMCIDVAWQEFLDAWTNRRLPNFSGIGIGYMMRGDYPTSNLDPFASAATPDNQWLDDAGPHIMLIVADASLLAGLPTDPHNGGPWVMWPGTPYAHVMIPVPRLAEGQ
jgi:hypothetical protein